MGTSSDGDLVGENLIAALLQAIIDQDETHLLLRTKARRCSYSGESGIKASRARQNQCDGVSRPRYIFLLGISRQI